MKQTHRLREQTCDCQGEVGVGKRWTGMDRRCKLVYIEWMNSKVLLYSCIHHLYYRMPIL